MSDVCKTENSCVTCEKVELSNEEACAGERENPFNRSETLYLDEVERYSPQFNRWTEVCKLLTPRSFGMCLDQDLHFYYLLSDVIARLTLRFTSRKVIKKCAPQWCSQESHYSEWDFRVQ